MQEDDDFYARRCAYALGLFLVGGGFGAYTLVTPWAVSFRGSRGRFIILEREGCGSWRNDEDGCSWG